MLRKQLPLLTAILCLMVMPELIRGSLTLTPVTECPPECPACPDLKGCKETRPDECACCKVCVRQHVNETCGVGIGVCADSMACSIVDAYEKIGRCEERWTEPCMKANCEIVFQPACPKDSHLVIPQLPPGECCPKKGTCQCDIRKCHQSVPVCKAGLERVRIKEGSNAPGNCCDEFECRAPPRKCENVDCPVYEDLFLEEECPEDSVRPASYVPQGACCPIMPDCRCKAAICSPARCPEDEALLITRKGDGHPGRCCDQFKCVKPSQFTNAKLNGKVKCTVGNKTYGDGEEFYQELCRPCVCRSGLVHCRDMQCSRVPSDCQWVGVPENECCPICFGCKDDNGTNRQPGEYWSKDDCTNCSCSDDFRTHCQKHICKSECDNPKKVEGQCCPVCDAPTIVELPVLCSSPEHCPLRCEHGLLRNQWGCFQCKCAPGIEPTAHNEKHECMELTDENCDKQCAHGYLKDNNGCPVCKCAKCPPIDQCYKHCLYGFETNSLGCPVCKCRPKSRIDARLMIKEKDVQKHVDSCISIMDDNKYVERDSGEWWTDNHCRQCFCQHKKEYCSLISCPPRPDTCPENQWITKKGNCCPSCATDQSAIEQKHGLTVCHSPGTGRLFVDGETWQLAECVSCTCRVSHVLCTALECPSAACKNPIVDPDNKCCRKCPENEANSLSSAPSLDPGFCTDEFGAAHALESEWRLDECVSCTCTRSGQIECFKEHCPAQTDCRGRPLMIKGRCCPVCSDSLVSDSVCTHDGNAYTVNEEFRDGPCRNCSCQPGSHLKCIELQCPPCSNPINVPGQCCPICNDPDSHKLYSSFRTGQESTMMVPEDQSMIYMYFLVAVALSILLLAVLIAIFLWSCYTKQASKKKKPLPSQPTIIVPEKSIISKPRNPSESESANVSLLSSHSDTSTAPSSNLSSGHGPHSETTPLTNSGHHESNLV